MNIYEKRRDGDIVFLGRIVPVPEISSSSSSTSSSSSVSESFSSLEYSTSSSSSEVSETSYGGFHRMFITPYTEVFE